jgi:hypothetical protein
MPLPHGWIATFNGSEIGRGSLADCLAAGVERGLIEVEIRIAAKSGDAMEKHIPARGLMIVPAAAIERGRRAA